MAGPNNKKKSNGRINAATVPDDKIRNILIRMDENVSYLKGRVDGLTQRVKQLEQGNR